MRFSFVLHFLQNVEGISSVLPKWERNRICFVFFINYTVSLRKMFCLIGIYLWDMFQGVYKDNAYIAAQGSVLQTSSMRTHLQQIMLKIHGSCHILWCICLSRRFLTLRAFHAADDCRFLEDGLANLQQANSDAYASERRECGETGIIKGWLLNTKYATY